MGDLDELLQSIKEEAKKENSLSLYEGTRQDDLVDKEVDERILRLLGLEEVFDIDYATYLSLLKERMAAARMANSPIPTEETELLTNEFKSVKSKVGRFKIKKKRITADDIRSSAPKIPKALLSPPESESKEDLTPNKKSAIESDLEPIDNKLDELINVIRKDFAAENKQQKLESRKEQNKSRDEKESKREQKKQSNILGSAAKLAVKPFTGILDRLKKFAMFTFAGFLADKVIKFFTDPENVKKREAMLDFLEDHGPKIFAGALLFLTPLGGLFLGLSATILKVIGGVAGGILKKAIRLLATPLGLKALATALLVGGGLVALDYTFSSMAGGSGFRAAHQANAETFRELERDAKIREDGTVLTKAVTGGGGFIAAREQIALPDGTTMMRPVTVNGDGSFMPAIDDPKFGGERLKRYGLTQDDVDRYRAAIARRNELRKRRSEMDAEVDVIKAERDEAKKSLREMVESDPDYDSNNEQARNALNTLLKEVDVRFQRQIDAKYEEYNAPLREEFSENKTLIDRMRTRLGMDSPAETESPSTEEAPVSGEQASIQGLDPEFLRVSETPISPVDAPYVDETIITRLPTNYEINSDAKPVTSGTEIPDFNVVNPYTHRLKVTEALGIGYLVG
jgi:hypothetical protein